MGSSRLPWADAFAILLEQPPATSALRRAMHPEDFDRTREAQLLEVVAVLLQRLILYGGNQSGASESQIPNTFEDLFKQPAAAERAEEDILASIAALDAFLEATTVRPE